MFSVVFYLPVLGICIFVIFIRGPRRWQGPLWGDALANTGLPSAFWWLAPQFPPLKFFYMIPLLIFGGTFKEVPSLWPFLTPSHSCVKIRKHLVFVFFLCSSEVVFILNPSPFLLPKEQSLMWHLRLLPLYLLYL